jgi:hypothetical protein
MCPLYRDLRSSILERLERLCPIFTNGPIDALIQELGTNIESITVTDLPPNEMVSFWEADPLIHIFKLLDDVGERAYLAGGDDDSPALMQTELPTKQLHNLWDSIIVPDDIKETLSGYCASCMQFAEAGVDSNIISFNRIIMLHGPPGSLPSY